MQTTADDLLFDDDSSEKADELTTMESPSHFLITLRQLSKSDASFHLINADSYEISSMLGGLGSMSGKGFSTSQAYLSIPDPTIHKERTFTEFSYRSGPN
ncbi:unnamed protein product [Dicrocoelium dendriticum]|nr:unnamed protein product [Dicrocoelium dendriticum]